MTSEGKQLLKTKFKAIVYNIKNNLKQIGDLDDGPEGKYAHSPFLPMMKEQRNELEEVTISNLMQLFKVIEALVDEEDASDAQA